MILFLVAAVVLYVGVPAGLIIGSVVAIPIGVAAGIVSLLAGGPGVTAAAGLTGSPSRPRRWAGWAMLAGCSVVAPSTAVVAIVMTAVVAGAMLALPGVMPFGD